MVSRYLKAFFLTMVILAIGIAAIVYLDDLRRADLERIVESRALELESSQQLFMYESVFSAQDFCSALVKRIESQQSEQIRVLSEIEAAQRNSLFSDSGLLKKRFLLQNVELYLLITKARVECGSFPIEPIIYFYPDKYYCTECASQAMMLDAFVRECPNARVFAFPADLGVPVIDLLAQKYSVGKYPTLVFNDQTYDYLVSAQELKSALRCNVA